MGYDAVVFLPLGERVPFVRYGMTLLGILGKGGGIDYEKDPVLRAEFLGREILFRKASNPHAASFFLSAAQYEYMASREDCGKLTGLFFDPMASAATYDILRSFEIYKADYAQSAFLEIEHIGQFPTRDGSIINFVEIHFYVFLQSLFFYPKRGDGCAKCGGFFGVYPKSAE